MVRERAIKANRVGTWLHRRLLLRHLSTYVSLRAWDTSLLCDQVLYLPSRPAPRCYAYAVQATTPKKSSGHFGTGSVPGRSLGTPTQSLEDGAVELGPRRTRAPTSKSAIATIQQRTFIVREPSKSTSRDPCNIVLLLGKSMIARSHDAEKIAVVVDHGQMFLAYSTRRKGPSSGSESGTIPFSGPSCP
jgi:hypothetical protein